ncbi:protein turtle-like isoform 2-T2 [Clarias gariepinus]|uniref:uncharacterized protein LOC128507522 isoform X2 n=1 Tax=Clarias gariepinus TaxID=13013 RepID=UPI00234D56B8|nr:uncharacterized protein LOC128507522 isoform X2 [Clarias gariepinus]
MILPALLFFCVCAGKPAELTGVIQVAEGSDMTLNCSSGVIEPHNHRDELNTRLKLNTTEYLLIKDFQSQDAGCYKCNRRTNPHTFCLELKAGSTNERIIYFRGSEGDSVLFFCKSLSSSSLKATWSWSDDTMMRVLPLDSLPFKNRLRLRKKENDFSLTISPVQWSDSGRFICDRSSSFGVKQSEFRLVLVRVSADPARVLLGRSVRLKCELSAQYEDSYVIWMNTETRETFPHSFKVEIIAPSQQSWVCVVIHSSRPKAMFPLTLNITRAFTTTSPSSSPPHHTTHAGTETLTHTAARNFTHAADTESNLSYTIIIIIITGVFIIFIFILVVTAVCCVKKPKMSRKLTLWPSKTHGGSANLLATYR